MSDIKPKGKRDSQVARRRLVRILLFPLAVGAIYGLIALVNPGQALVALEASGLVLLKIVPALVIAFGVMVLLNLMVTPGHIKRFLGKETRAKGGLLSSAAGILSMGSIYVWYPLLKELREKGISDFHLANFLGCRAVKIPLMPMMAAYFGWSLALILSCLIIFEAVLTGLLVSKLGAFDGRPWGPSSTAK